MNTRRKNVLRRSPTRVLGLSALVLSAPAWAQETAVPAASSPARLDSVVIQGTAQTPAAAAKAEVKDVPGGASVVDAGDVEKRAVLTNQDTLSYQPGVFAQSAGGTDGIKISVRGSAINRGTNFFRSGVLFLFDGLPVTGPGGTPYELFEPLGLSYTEILRGANAFDLGAVQFGGAINYVTRTGYNAPLFGVRVEGGSYGYGKIQLQSGQVIGPWDYYVSLTGSTRDGWQDQTAGNSKGIAANVGYRVNPDLDTRFYLRYRETKNEQAGALTRQQIEDNPRQANPTNVAQSASRIQPGSTWLANKTTYRIDEASKVEVGAVYHDYPIDQQLSVNRGEWGFTDASLSARYLRTDTIAERESRTILGVLSTKHLDAYLDTSVRIPAGATAGLAPGTLIRHAEYGGLDTVFHAGNDTEVVDKLWLTTGLSAINVQRSTEVTYPATNEPYSRNEWHLAPRAGVRFDVSPTLQVFGNVSRTVEPPNSWAVLTTPPAFTSGPQTGLSRRGLDLQDQTATTFEVGARGTAFTDTNWSVSVYRADLKNELLSVEVIPATATAAAVTTEANASPTVHQGIEAGFDAVLWKNAFLPGASFTTRQAYTYSDFFFKSDARWGKNKLPGVPKHFYQADVNYQLAGGFYTGVNVQVANAYYVDYANSFATKKYAVWGAQAGYEPSSKQWQAYIDLRNIADKHYAATISPTYNDNGTDQRRSSPGDGFTVYAGFAYNFK